MSSNNIALIILGVIVSAGGVGGCLWGYPQYHVYEQGLAGQAKLREAEFSRQVLTQEAHAKMESAKLLAEAEVERAKGVAAENKIIGDSLHNNESYLRYLWIQGLEHAGVTVVYVPTEANLPILEAGKRPPKP